MNLPVTIEVHHQLVKKYSQVYFDLERVFLNQTIPLEYQLVYLSWHASKHGFHRFIWFCDIAEIINKNKHLIDWQRAIQQSRDFNAQKQYLFTMNLVFTLLLPRFSDTNISRYNRVLFYIPKILFLKIQKKILNQKHETFLRYLLSIYLMKH